MSETHGSPANRPRSGMLSQSAYIPRKATDQSFEEDEVSIQISQLQERMARANNFRLKLIEDRVNLNSNLGQQVDQIKAQKQELFEKHQLDIMGKVVMKHHEKEKFLKKEQKKLMQDKQDEIYRR